MIGIFGGTFDPIHFGHLRTALDVAESMRLEQVRFIPCGVPPHREQPVASAEQRLAMVRSAIEGQTDFVVDEREIHRNGPSYMVDTLLSLRNELGSDIPLGLILGLDAFCTLETWHRWSRLIELAHILVMTRPGWHSANISGDGVKKLFEQHATQNPQECHHRAAGCVVSLPVSQMAISSTQIRQAIQAGRSIRYWLPERVRELIMAEQIYKFSGNDE